MDKLDQQQFDLMKLEIANLKRLAFSMAKQIKNLEKENIRIKHEVRTARSQILFLDSKIRGG